MRKVNLEAMVPVFEAFPNVRAVWIFGSAKNGELRPDADFDMGTLFETKPKLEELAELRARLQEAAELENIHLVVLNGASPILRFEAVSGRPLFCRDPNERAGFVSLTAREYEDEMAFATKYL